MGAALLLLLQTAAASPPERIDLMLPSGGSACRQPTGDEIVVCGSRPDAYRLGKPDPRFEAERPFRAEAGVLGGRAGVEVDAVPMPGGLQSNRLMVRLKAPF